MSYSICVFVCSQMFMSVYLFMSLLWVFFISSMSPHATASKITSLRTILDNYRDGGNSLSFIRGTCGCMLGDAHLGPSLYLSSWYRDLQGLDF